MSTEGPCLHTESVPKALVKKNTDGSLTLQLENGQEFIVDSLIWAIGRQPATDNLNLAITVVKTNEQGYYINVDKFQNTSVKGICAVGNITGALELTPVAVVAGRHLSKRLFNNNPEEPIGLQQHCHCGIQPPADQYHRSDRARSHREIRRG